MEKHDKCDMTMFSVWHFVLFSPKLIQLNKVTQLTKSLTQLSYQNF